MDVKAATKEHISTVSILLHKVARAITHRGIQHDASKLISPEVEMFEEYTPKLHGLTYGSPEYAACLKDMRVALVHHYANNRHHPEYHPNGIRGMNLIDLTEMLADWRSAAARHADGDIYKSLEINQKRFGYSDELKQIFINTIKAMEAL